MVRVRTIAAMLPLVALGCTATETRAPVDDADPQDLTFYAPAVYADPTSPDHATPVVPAGQPFELGVATQNDAVAVLHFVLDGVEIGACDTTADAQDCHDGALWRWTTQVATPGSHVAEAWYQTLAGAVVRARIAFDVQAVSSATSVPQASAATDADPTPDAQLELYATGDFTDPASEDALQRAADQADDEAAAADDGTDQTDGPAVSVEPSTDALDYAFASSTHRGYLDPSTPTHGAYGGVRWSTQGQRVTFGGVVLEGDAFDAASCWADLGASIARYGDLNYVSRAALVAAALAATDCDLGAPTNVMGLPRAVCVAVTALSPAPLDAVTCEQRMHDAPDFAVQMAAAWMASDSLRRLHHDDPPLMAAVYSTGALAASRANPWHLLAPRDYSGDHDFVTTYVAAYNAFRTAERTGEVDPDLTPEDADP